MSGEINLERLAQECRLRVRQVGRVVSQLRKDGHLPPEPDDPTKPMKRYLSQRQHLSVAQLLELIDHPQLIPKLGPAHADLARAQIRSLGKLQRGNQPELWDHVINAVNRVPEGLDGLESWMRATIPQGGCDYYYLAVRVLLVLEKRRWSIIMPRVQPAFAVVKSRPSFQGWFTVLEDKMGRRSTTFHPPKGNPGSSDPQTDYDL